MIKMFLSLRWEVKPDQIVTVVKIDANKILVIRLVTKRGAFILVPAIFA
jgi:hypothetical protein